LLRVYVAQRERESRERDRRESGDEGLIDDNRGIIIDVVE